MVFQVYIDESGNEPQSPIFVFGGFVATYDQWAKFSSAWDEELKKEPKLDYFKMSEAARLGGQFSEKRGWTAATRDLRVARFASIIRDYAKIRVLCWVRHVDWQDQIMSLEAPIRRLYQDSPYTHMFIQTIYAVAVFQDRHGINDPCDFIFDDTVGFRDEALWAWDNAKDILKNSARSDLIRFIGSPPIFRNEIDFLPLQAADLYAWQILNHYTVNHKVAGQTIRIPKNRILQTLWPIQAISRELSTEEMERLREHPKSRN